METNLRKWSSMLYVLCLAMVMTMMPITTDAAETRDLVVTTGYFNRAVECRSCRSGRCGCGNE